MKLIKDLRYRTLLWFSIPTILSSVLEPLAGFVDTALVGNRNTTWLASLAVSTIILSSFTWMFNFLVHASTQGVSQAANNEEQLGERVRISLIVASVVGIVSSIFVLSFRKFFYSLAGAEAELVPIIEDYFIIRICGHLFTVLYMTFLSIIRGLGHIQLTLLLVSVTTATNLFLSYFLLYIMGWGIEGAAWGTVLANVFGCILCFGWMLSKDDLRKFFSNWNMSSGNWLHFGKNSRELFLRSLFLSSTFFLATRFATEIGIRELAAHQILIQLWLFGSFFLDGIAITGNILGARFLVEGKKEELKLVFSRLLHLGGVIGLAFTIVFFFFETYILDQFTNDTEVINVMKTIWLWIVLTQVINALAFVYDGLLFGLGEFSYLRKHIMIGCVLIFLPIALYSKVTNGLLPIWFGMMGLNVYRVLIGFIRTRKVLRSHA